MSFASEYFPLQNPLTTKHSWEFFTSLWFEWQIITGKRSYRWSIWVRAATRPRSDLLLIFFAALFWLSLLCPLRYHHNLYWVQCHDSHKLSGTRRAVFFFHFSSPTTAILPPYPPLTGMVGYGVRTFNCSPFTPEST